MMQCQTCIHWDGPEPGAKHNNGICGAILHGNDKNYDATQLAEVCDESGYYASLVTDGNFGCVLWKEDW